MTDYISTKIKNLSLVAMLMVVVIHAHNATLSESSLRSISFWTQKLIARGICDIAVPFFFVISGYLFSLQYVENLQWFVKKIKKRIKSLVVPYFLFAVIGGALSFPLVIFANLHAGRELFDNTILADTPGWIFALDRFIGFSVAPKMNLHLWFLRVLILIVLLSPGLLPLAYRARRFGFFLAVGLYLLLPGTSGLLQGLNCFLAGAFLSFNPLSVGILKNRKVLLGIVIAALMGFIMIVFLKYAVTADVFWVEMTRRLSIVLGLLSLYYCYDLFNITKCLKFAEFSFWIYCVHMPLEAYLNVAIKEVCGYICHNREIVSLATFVILPVITVVASVCVGIFLKKYAGNFYRVLSGGR